MTPEERQRPLTIADLTIDIGATSKEEVKRTKSILVHRSFQMSKQVNPDLAIVFEGARLMIRQKRQR